jgi:hypothetical protein
MQFIEGDDLRKLLERQQDRFPQAEVVGWARTVLDALCYLHDHVPPIVHRDIKPANLKRTPRGDIILLDFGLAKGRPGEPATRLGDRSLFGYTLSYSPLEQILGRRTDPRSDVYSIGATLYHLLTGLPPVNALDRQQAVASGKADPLQVAHLVEGGIAENLGRLIARAMALDGAERYASGVEMRAALSECGVDDTTQITLPDHRAVSRRIDAAVPSRGEVGRRLDLLVQVRFEGSPSLGLEDWPSKQRPTAIEQVSEELVLEYPTDPQTGRLLPARLRVKVIAPDFRIEDQRERLIDVPPDEYSKRLAFLLTPLRTGVCRINVEVYGVDTVFLGAVPVEVEAMAATVRDQDISVGNLPLDVVARQVAALLLGAGLAGTPVAASLPAGAVDSRAVTTFPPVAVPLDKEPAGQRDIEALGAPTAFRMAAEAQLSEASPASRPVPPVATERTLEGRVLRAALWTAPLAVVIVGATLVNWRRDAPPAAPVPAPSAAPAFPTALAPPALTSPPPPVPAAADPAPPQMSAPVPSPASAKAGTSAGRVGRGLASTLAVAARPGETAAERNSRETLARVQLDDGKRALEEHRYADAIDRLGRAVAVSNRPDYGYTAGEAVRLLEVARGAKAEADASQARAHAQKLVDQARALAGSDIVSAVKRLREALALDPTATGASKLMKALEDQLVVRGEAALLSARNFDRYKRTSEALREFDRAIQLLELVPGGHRDLAFARQRSAALKAPR